MEKTQIVLSDLIQIWTTRLKTYRNLQNRKHLISCGIKSRSRNIYISGSGWCSLSSSELELEELSELSLDWDSEDDDEESEEDDEESDDEELSDELDESSTLWL